MTVISFNLDDQVSVIETDDAPYPGWGFSCEIVTVKLDDVFAILTKRKSLADIKWEQAREARIKELMDMGVERLRHLWDNVSDETSFYEGEFGLHDCADIHTALNRLGDGYYCAV